MTARTTPQPHTPTMWATWATPLKSPNAYLLMSNDASFSSCYVELADEPIVGDTIDLSWEMYVRINVALQIVDIKELEHPTSSDIPARKVLVCEVI